MQKVKFFNKKILALIFYYYNNIMYKKEINFANDLNLLIKKEL